jgi:5'-deoxynucleotidase YfbR-like HD superfamily hydrolase
MQEKEYRIAQIDFIRLGGLVTRYHTKNTIQPNTVGHHSFGVAWMIYLLTQGSAETNLVYAALAHDLAEQVTGDISSPTKRKFPELATMVQLLEDETLESHGLFFQLSKDEARILKIADCLDGMLYCISEFEIGNKSIMEVYKRYEQYINAMTLNEHERSVFNSVRAIMMRKFDVG